MPAVSEGLERDASALLGGDIEIEASNLPLAEDELDALTPAGARRVDTVRTNAMARSADGRRVVVSLKAVDQAYPLYGAVTLDPASLSLDEALADGGVVVERGLLTRLGVRLGDPAQDRRGRVRHPRGDRARAGPHRRLRQHRPARDDPARRARAPRGPSCRARSRPLRLRSSRCRRAATSKASWRGSRRSTPTRAGGRAGCATSSPRSPASPTVWRAI